jgi:hypothetical protein
MQDEYATMIDVLETQDVSPSPAMASSILHSVRSGHVLVQFGEQETMSGSSIALNCFESS